MNLPGSGFIIQINYSSYTEAEIIESYAITTQTGIPLLTQNGIEIDIEH